MNNQQNRYQPPEPRVIALAAVKPRSDIFQTLWIELSVIVLASLGVFYLAASPPLQF